MKLLTRTLKIAVAVYAVGVGLFAVAEVTLEWVETRKPKLKWDLAKAFVFWPVVPYLIVKALVKEILNRLGIYKYETGGA